jgi:hypothetical protein
MRAILTLIGLLFAAAVVSGQDLAPPSSVPVNPICEWAFDQAAARVLADEGTTDPGTAPNASADPGAVPGPAGTDLDDAVRMCASVDDWDAGAALHPEGLRGADPREFLADRCADPAAGFEVYSTCVSLVHALATPAPTPVPTATPTPAPTLEPEAKSTPRPTPPPASRSDWNPATVRTARQYMNSVRRLHVDNLPEHVWYLRDAEKAALRRDAEEIRSSAVALIKAHLGFMSSHPPARCFRDAYVADRRLLQRWLTHLDTRGQRSADAPAGRRLDSRLDELDRATDAFIAELGGYFRDCR